MYFGVEPRVVSRSSTRSQRRVDLDVRDKMTIEEYQSVHECEEIHLQLKEPCDFSQLKKLILDLKGEQEIDSYFFKRSDPLEIWQQPHFAALQPLCDSTYSFCWSMWFSCLIAEIPQDQTLRFLSLIKRFMNEYEGTAVHRNQSYSFEDLEALFDGYVSEIESVWHCKPGSKRLADLIVRSDYYEAGRDALAADRARREPGSANKASHPTADSA